MLGETRREGGAEHRHCVCVLMFQELRNAHSEEIMGIRREEEMEMSDDDSDENPCKKLRTEENGTDQYQSIFIINIHLKMRI